VYKLIRKWHKWIGATFALFLLSIALSGFILANKDRWTWIKPATAKGAAPAFTGKLTLAQIAMAAVGSGHPELRTLDDIDRMELHADKSVVKVRSKGGYGEVQVCAFSGRVLAMGTRWDQFAENVHDLRWISVLLRDWVLPFVAIGLAYMALSGVGMVLVPVIRRRRFLRTQRDEE
jgi:hypothetical protein